jgi:F420-non-reducing hydrogenase iron-sulfur subunit
MTKSEFKPKIVGFLCNWCSYAGADLAGVSRIQYPSNLRIVRVMCSGRVHPAFILEAFKNGADGVLVAACHPGDCHYISGNEKAQNRVLLLKKTLEPLGLDPERLRLEWISASEGDRFAMVIRDMTKELTKLGPSPLKVGDKISA